MWSKQNLKVLTILTTAHFEDSTSNIQTQNHNHYRTSAGTEQKEVKFTSLWTESLNTQPQNKPIYFLTRCRIAEIVQWKNGKKEKQKSWGGLGRTFLYVQHQTEALFGLLTRKSWYADLLGRLPWSQHIGEKNEQQVPLLLLEKQVRIMQCQTRGRKDLSYFRTQLQD